MESVIGINDEFLIDNEKCVVIGYFPKDDLISEDWIEFLGENDSLERSASISWLENKTGLIFARPSPSYKRQ